MERNTDGTSAVVLKESAVNSSPGTVNRQKSDLGWKPHPPGLDACQRPWSGMRSNYQKVGAFGCFCRSSQLIGTVGLVFLSSRRRVFLHVLGLFFFFKHLTLFCIWLNWCEHDLVYVAWVLPPYSDIFQWFQNRYVKHIWFYLNIEKANSTVNSN